jgi:hypothetical protein
LIENPVFMDIFKGQIRRIAILAEIIVQDVMPKNSNQYVQKGNLH